MSEEQLKAFLEAVKADDGLQENLNAATDVDAAVAIAKEMGFVVSADELQRAHLTELTDEELEGVAGGCSNTHSKSTGNPFYLPLAPLR